MPLIFVSFWFLSAIGVIWKLQAFVTLHRLHRRSRKGTIAWIMTLSYACVDWSLHLIVKPGLQLCNFFLMCFGDGLILVHPSCSWHFIADYGLSKAGCCACCEVEPKLMQFSLFFFQHLNNDDSCGMFILVWIDAWIPCFSFLLLGGS